MPPKKRNRDQEIDKPPASSTAQHDAKPTPKPAGGLILKLKHDDGDRDRVAVETAILESAPHVNLHWATHSHTVPLPGLNTKVTIPADVEVTRDKSLVMGHELELLCRKSNHRGRVGRAVSLRPHSLEIVFPNQINLILSDEAAHLLAGLDFQGCEWLLQELYGWECEVVWKDEGWGNAKGMVGLCDAEGTRFVNSFTPGPAPHAKMQENVSGNFPSFHGMSGLAQDNKMFLFAKGHRLTIHQLKVRFITRSGVAFNTLNLLHIVRQLKTRGGGRLSGTRPDDGDTSDERCTNDGQRSSKKKGGDEDEASSNTNQDDDDDETTKAIIASLGSAVNPVPHDVLLAIFEFLYLPLTKLPELFHRTPTSSGDGSGGDTTAATSTKFAPDAMRQVRDAQVAGTFLKDCVPYVVA
jgi:hypothetical protein